MSEPTVPLRANRSRSTTPSLSLLAVVETHISLLLFAGDRVYKIRKPVRFGFLDFSDRQQREADCHREVALNRRLAPDVYLGVADVVMNGEPIDHIVVMRSLPHERALATLVCSGADTDPWTDQVASVLSAFHADAPRSADISAAATSGTLRQKWQANFEESDQFVGDILDPIVEAQIRTLVPLWLRNSEQLLEDRITNGCICDGHGDLQAEDVFCLDDGVRILDCLEFSDELRHADVCADVAFLAMDLERLEHSDAAYAFVASYERYSGDPLPKPLLHHYIAHYAYIRAKVACLSAEQGVEGDDATALGLQLLALRHLRRAQFALVLVGGLPGSGKSTLAAALADDTGWVLLRSDEVRQRMAPMGDRYSAEAVEAVYTEILCRTWEHLAHRESVILDGTWLDAQERDRAKSVADDWDAPLLQLQCVCPDPIASDRIDERLRLGEDASEATVAVRRSLADRSDTWSAARVIDTSTSTPAEEVETALQALSSN